MLDPMDRADPNLELSRGGVDAEARGEFTPDTCSLIGIEWRSPGLFRRAPQSSHDPFAQNRPLELGKN